MRKLKLLTILLTLNVIFCSSLYGQKAPAGMAAAIIIKILPFEKNTLNAKDIDFFVLGSSELTNELQKTVGKKLGKLNVTAVNSGDELPSTKPSIMIIEDPKFTVQGIEYARTNKVLTITRFTDIQEQGVSVLIELVAQKPKIQISVEGSTAEGLQWSPAIFKIAHKLK